MNLYEASKITEGFDLDKFFLGFGIKKFEVQPNSVIDVYQNVEFNGYQFTDQQLPFTFGEVRGNFSIQGCNLTTLKGSPVKVGGGFFCGKNPITSLEFAPSEANTYACSETEITSFHNINLIVQKAKHFMIRKPEFVSGVLGFLLIEGLETVEFPRPMREIEAILNEHLRGDRDIHLCQEDLFDAGFAKYATI